ncbi:hypothetical protein VKT23_001396 [Stygiomarasmius scandens]|uniref:HMG box domain-containing protein n=1 Tax=Marasmiellus scandens TaxID=2682957 RepID=A0ABR1JYQ6_9AGAR
MPKKWVQAAQLGFLNSKVPDFVKAQLEGKVHTHFEPLLWAEWTTGGYDLVPVPGEDASETEKNTYRQHVSHHKQQLISWFYNDATKRKQQGSISNDTIQNIVSTSSSRSKGKRSHTDIQSFSSTHYNELVKPKVDFELEQLCAQSGGKLVKGAHLPVVTRVTKDVWESLSEDTKREVKKKREEEEFNEKRGMDGRKIIKEFPKYLNTICNKICAETNFTVSIMVGGWDETEQQIVVHSFHAGENELGLPFNVAHPEYKIQWSDVFGKFASSYIKAERIRNPNADPPVSPKKSPSSTQLTLVLDPFHSAPSELPVQLASGPSPSTIPSPSISSSSGPALSIEGPHHPGTTSQSVPSASAIPSSQSSSAPLPLNEAHSQTASIPCVPLSQTQRPPPAALPSQTVFTNTVLHPAHFSPITYPPSLPFPLDPVLQNTGTQTGAQGQIASSPASLAHVPNPSSLGPSEPMPYFGPAESAPQPKQQGRHGRKRKIPSEAEGGDGTESENPAPKKKGRGRKKAELTENDKGENACRSGRERHPPTRYIT